VAVGRFVRIWASWEAKFPEMGDSLQRTPMNHRAKFEAASFILAGEIFAGGGIRGVINNFGGSRGLLITVTVQLISTELVAWKSVDDRHFAVTCM